MRTLRDRITQEPINRLQGGIILKRFMSSQLATVICVIFLAASRLSAAGAADLMPEASPGFAPKVSYPQDAGTIIQAVTDTLNALSIPVAASSNGEIVTDYVEGPTTQVPGRITHSRYRFTIAVVPAPRGGGTRMHISVTTQASSGPDGSPVNWRDVSLFNLGVEHKTGNWLYENVEHTLTTGSPATAASAMAPGASPATTGQPGGVDPHTLTLAGVRLGMTETEAITAMQKENPGMLVMHESYRMATNAQDAGSPFSDDQFTFAGNTDATNAEQAKKIGETLVAIEAIDSNIAADLHQRVHLKGNTAWVTDQQGHEVILFPGGNDSTAIRYNIKIDDGPRVKDAASIMRAGVGLECSHYSNKDYRALDIAFSPRSGKVIGIGFEQDFCDRDNLPQIQTMHDALFRRFPRDVTLDTADPGHKFNVDGRDVVVLWQYDTHGQLLSYNQRQRSYGNLGFGMIASGMSVTVYARVKSVAAETRGHADALSGNPDSLASSALHIQLTDADGFIRYGDELVAATTAAKANIQKNGAANSNKKLDTNTSRAAF